MMTVSLHGAYAAGRVALVDDEDFDLVSQHRWRILEIKRTGRSCGPYAQTTVHQGTRRVTVLMHCLILGYKGIDHINHDGLDNQRHNLRSGSALQNKANQRPRLDSFHSSFKGVTWHKRSGRTTGGRWTARIDVHGRRQTLGYFLSEEEAARAYDAAALAAWGEYAWLNFPTCETG